MVDVPPATNASVLMLTSAPDVPTDKVTSLPPAIIRALVAVPLAATVALAIALAVTTPPDAAPKPEMLCVTNVVPPARITSVPDAYVPANKPAAVLRAAKFNDGIFKTSFE